MSSNDFKGTHHVVGLVFEDVAVVEVFARVAREVNDYAGDGAWGTLDNVLPAHLVGIWGDGVVPAFSVEQHHHGVLILVLIVVEGDGAGNDRGRLRGSRNGANGLRNRVGDGCGGTDCDAKLHEVEAAVAEMQRLARGVREVDKQISPFAWG